MADPAALLQRLDAALGGRYKIDRSLGRGGMATVFRAVRTADGVAVAVKLLQPELTTAQTAERFLREIQFTTQLDHPNIVRLLDSGTGDGLVWYVMPLIEGESLRERLMWEKLQPVGAAVELVRQLAMALHHAHGLGLVHRDLKPENVLMAGDRPLLADFGIARALHDLGQARITAAGMPMGTPAYMSPEQITGEALDLRSDVYGLGCLLFEMVGGQPPFVAPSAARVMQMHLVAPPPSLGVLRPGVPAALELVAGRALAKEPAARYPTAAAMAEALASVASATATPAVPPESRFKQWVGRLGGKGPAGGR